MKNDLSSGLGAALDSAIVILIIGPGRRRAAAGHLHFVAGFSLERKEQRKGGIVGHRSQLRAKGEA